MRILALVPARGGSKRVPRKNVRALLDVPLIVWTLRTARESGVCTDIVVSTDDGEIAEIAHRWGAEVLMRPPELATDTAGSVDVALHALDQVSGPTVEGLLLLQPTSPFRMSASLQRAVAMFSEDPHRAPVISVSPATPHPAWCFTIEGERLQPVQGWIGLEKRSQDLTPAYALNGSVYLVAPATLRSRRAFLTVDARPLVMENPLEAVDIDTPEDWAMAEAVARLFDNGRKGREA